MSGALPMQAACAVPAVPAVPRAAMRCVPWAISAERFQDTLAQLKFEYFKWDMYMSGTCRILPESIVLSRETHAQLVAVAEACAALLRRFEAAARRDARFIEALGIDPALAPLLAAESAREPAFARADFFLTPEGEWVLSEFNEDAPGGFNEAVGLHEILDAGELGGVSAGDLRAALCGAFAGLDSVGFVYATAFSEDLQHCAVLEKWLSRLGHRTVRAGPDRLRRRWRGTYLGGRRIDGLFRFYPGEWLGLVPNAADWVRALPKLTLVNPPVRMLSQSKKSFRLLRESDLLDSSDRALARRYCPVTRDFDPLELERYRRERERLVLKRAFGRMGDAVVIGALVSEQDWNAALSHAAARAREFAMQERFDVAPLEFEAGILYPTIGVYTVNGRFAGYYSRVAPQPFITHEAYHVATVLEAA
jgi:hypothetical protein